jgi:hypothetical protein
MSAEGAECVFGVPNRIQSGQAKVRLTGFGGFGR